MFIHEPVFVLAAMPAIAGVMLLKAGRSPRWGASLLGFGVGAMASTRETVVISLAAWGGALILYAIRVHYRPSWRLTLHPHRPRIQPFLYAAGFALAVIFLAYSSGGRNPAGFFDFFRTYFAYQPVAGHEKAFGYFFHMLVWPKFQAGVWWTEGGILLFAFCVYLGRRDHLGSATGRFLLEAGLLHLLFHSLIPYKTPWLASLGWLHVCLAAGFGVVALTARLRGKGRWVPVALMMLLTGWHGIQAHRAAIRLGSDDRNPYAYVPTSSDLERLPAFVDQLKAALSGRFSGPIAVIGPDYWPLPWYLRDCGPAGYWQDLPDDGQSLTLLLILPDALEAAVSQLEDTHFFLPWGLRHETPLIVAVRNDAWAAYQASQ